MTAKALPLATPNDTVGTLDKTEEFLAMFTKIRNIKSKESEESSCLEENIHHLLVFYERHKRLINRKCINKIMFSELPDLCFEEHVEDSNLLVDVLRTIDGLPPVTMPHLFLFLTVLGLTHRTLHRDVIVKRNEMQKSSFSSLNYFLYHAYKKRLTIQGKRLTDMIVCTNPLLFSKLLFFADARCTQSLLQFGLRFEFSEKPAVRFHPIFICAAELISRFIEQVDVWSSGSLEKTAQQEIYLEKLFTFCRNFKLLLISTSNPYAITSQLIYTLLQGSEWNDVEVLRPFLGRFLPREFETYQPPSLQHSCRYAIRSTLHEKWCLPYGIWRLSLPRKLSRYLNFTIDEKGKDMI